MRTSIKYSLMALLSVPLISHNIFAQRQVPKAVLIELNSYKNKVDHYLKNNHISDAELIKTQAETVISYTQKDFKDNFDVCPVYYFVDTNINYIKEHKFKTILLNSDMSVVKDTPFSQNDTNYIIVYQGFDVEQGLNGLVVLNSNGKKIGFFYKPQMHFANKSYKKYTCIFNNDQGIGYLPYAIELKRHLLNQ
ncbi:MAG: hypothetical protein WCG87_06880 [Bacteroidota bacterium]